jgi:hypothetical protein
VQKVLIWYNLISQVLLLFLEPLESDSERCCLSFYLQEFSTGSFKLLGLTTSLWNILNLLLNMVRGKVLFVFHVWVSSFLSTICWRGCLFSICFWCPCQESGDCILF